MTDEATCAMDTVNARLAARNRRTQVVADLWDEGADEEVIAAAQAKCLIAEDNLEDARNVVRRLSREGKL